MSGTDNGIFIPQSVDIGSKTNSSKHSNNNKKIERQALLLVAQNTTGRSNTEKNISSNSNALKDKGQ